MHPAIHPATRQPCPPSTSYGVTNHITPVAPPAHRPPTLPATTGLSRRSQLALLAPLLWLPPRLAQAADSIPPPAIPAPPAPSTAGDALEAGKAAIPNYAAMGPCQPVRLPQLEHYCTVCRASSDRCRVRIQAFYPKGGARAGLSPPFPLAIISSGFLIAADQYASYAARLASWGYCVLTYDATQSALDPLPDTGFVDLLRDLIDWVRVTEPLAGVTNTESVLLVGHSRGGKIAALTAAVDARVKSVFLLDPVDVTVYAPLASGYPSAVAALRGLAAGPRPPLPIAIVGSGRGADCAPADSNYDLYFDAAPGAAFAAVLEDAGHLQYLDARGANLMDAVCLAGNVPDAAVSDITKAVMVAWAEATLRAEDSTRSAIGRRDSSHGSEGSTGDPGSPGLRFGVDAEGRVVAGPFPAMDALTRVYAAVRAGQERVEGGGGREVRVETRAKNFAF